MKVIPMLIFVALIFTSAWGFNSLVREADIARMQELGVSREVIDYLVSHQTSSIGSKDVIRMKSAGMSNDQILSAIKSDLYEQAHKPTVVEEADLITQLKKAGLSDEAVLQFLDRVRTTRRVDAKGKVTTSHTTESMRPRYPVSGAELPQIENYGYDPVNQRFLILVQPKIE